MFSTGRMTGNFLGEPYMEKQKVLFVCIHNSARSQMAEAFLHQLAGERYEAESAGIEPGILNPLAVAVMKEVNIDISEKQTRDVFDLYKQGKIFRYVISVCEEASERCPIFPSISKRLSWSFPDPSTFMGSYEEKIAQTRAVRDQIKRKIEEWLNELTASVELVSNKKNLQ
jgi:arsenate reductase (thioredoxin)